MGLATKAGKIASGEFAAESGESGKAHLVIVSEEASDNTRKMFQNMCVLTTRSRFTFFGRKKKELRGTQWEKRCGHLWPYWMQVFPRHS